MPRPLHRWFLMTLTLYLKELALTEDVTEDLAHVAHRDGPQQFSDSSALKYSKLVQQSRKSPLPSSSPSTSKAPGLFGTGKDGLLHLQWQQYPQTHLTFLARQEWATHPILSSSTPNTPSIPSIAGINHPPQPCLGLSQCPRPTRSTTTSLLKVFLHSAATLHT